MRTSPTNIIVAVLAPLSTVLCSLITSDPVAAQRTGLTWASYLGGKGFEQSRSQCLTPGGDIVIGGHTDSTDFPMMNPWQGTYGGSPASLFGLGDGFVACMSADGSRLVWSTYLGGSQEDSIAQVAADATGVTVCGFTRSPNFPTTPGAFQTSLAGQADGFVARFNWNGQRLQLSWSTLLGGSSNDSISGLAVDSSGRIFVTGTTASSDFPMRGKPYQSANAGAYDGFVAVFDATGSKLMHSTYLGGQGNDSAWTWGGSTAWAYVWAFQIALDTAGQPVVAGMTDSRNFPTTAGAYQSTNAGGFDGVIVRMDRSLTRLTYSTYFGGNRVDILSSLVMTPAGHIAVSGATGSSNYPTTAGCLKPSLTPATRCFYADGCVSVLDTRAQGGAQLVYSTYHGGTGCDHTMPLSVDSRGMLLLGGITEASDLRTTPGALQSSLSGVWDAHLAQIDPTQTGTAQLRYGTYLGSNCSGYELAGGIPDGMGNAFLSGHTACSNFRWITPGCYQPTFGGGGGDLFVAMLNLLPQGMTRYGWSTSACGHPIYQSVNSLPAAGNTRFTLEVTGAPPSAIGWLAFGTPFRPGWNLLPGLRAFLAPTPVVPIRVTADGRGHASFGIAIPASTKGVPPFGIATQWFFQTTAGCPGSGPYAASEGLAW